METSKTRDQVARRGEVKQAAAEALPKRAEFRVRQPQGQLTKRMTQRRRWRPNNSHYVSLGLSHSLLTAELP
ncbi:hypothetical protein J6590_069406 [Homalodisca vitripennis]|nr:hypothetical protein J6590_069406 [Homalodisca vitripennis]